ncbi:MAG: RnfABCDGE type electron transport complex subunit D [Oscillospiraceae bacterium]|nr:RnfABCDGE type electron transport complex subunit D [Oscillospiraceae bacterium]
MNLLTVTSSPHIACRRSTRGIMLDVVIALLPALAASIWLFGARSALLVGVCVVSCVAFEWLYEKLMHLPVTVGDLSAVVTGMLLAFNLPSTLPVWMTLVGSFVSIIVVKQLFGGIGCNFVNPALAGRVVMAVSFASAMTDYAYPATAVDVLSSATPLHLIEQGGGDGLSALTLFLGNYGGVLGETSCAALLLGFIWLVVRGVIKPVIPVTYIGSTLLFSWMFGCVHPLYSILSGGLFLGAIFMATDYTTVPYSDAGKLVYGLGLGLLTSVIRIYANSTEGVSYAILLMNLVVPYINGGFRRRPLGAPGPEKGKKIALAAAAAILAGLLIFGAVHRIQVGPNIPDTSSSATSDATSSATSESGASSDATSSATSESGASSDASSSATSQTNAGADTAA